MFFVFFLAIVCNLLQMLYPFFNYFFKSLNVCQMVHLIPLYHVSQPGPLTPLRGVFGTSMGTVELW